MAYLLQTQEHANQQPPVRYARPGDVVVSDDFRAVYSIAKDNSRRRIKDQKIAQSFVDLCKTRIEQIEAERAQKRLRAEAERIQRAAGPDAPETLVVHPDSKSNAAQVVALLAAGLAMEAGLPHVGA